MKKRIITVIMALALVLGTFYPVNPESAYAANEETQENMTEVLLKVKTKLELPDEYSEFSSNYNNYGTKATWSFHWSTADSSKNINLQCDDEGHIISMNRYTNTNDSSIPDKTSKEMTAEVEELLGRVFPEAKGHVVLENTYCSYYQSAYRFNFTRIENGIEMPDNYVALSVSYIDGELVSANCNWNYTAKVPDAKKLISAEEAKKKISEQLSMNLYYYVTRDEEGKDKVFLAYTPSMSYIAANAKTGKIYTTKNYWGEAAKEAAEEAMDAEVNATGDSRSYEAKLSEAELKRIEDLKNLISADDAVKIIKNNKYLLVEETLNSVTSNLREVDGKYVWYITLRDNRPEDYEKNDYYRAYASASIDAETGKILSYSASLKSLYYYSQEEVDGIKFNYSKKECKKIFESFVKEVEKEKLAKTKLDSTTETGSQWVESKGTSIYMAYAFRYTRYNDGVPFVSNGISGSVDRVSGKIYSYYVNWTDAKVPSAKKVIGADKAYDAYMNYEGFDLVYEIVNLYENTGSIYGYENEQTIRLVYRTAISPAYVDAFTGKQLSYNGEEYEKIRTDYNYSDIAGTKYEKAIRILAEMGVGLPGENYEPDKKITKNELASMISKMPVIGYRDLSEELSGDKSLTRQAAAKAMINIMGLKKIAVLDIYKLPYSDAKEVGKSYKGYVALAGGLGLFGEAEGGKFGPKVALTRGEAAQLLLNAVSVLMSEE